MQPAFSQTWKSLKPAPVSASVTFPTNQKNEALRGRRSWTSAEVSSVNEVQMHFVVPLLPHALIMNAPLIDVLLTGTGHTNLFTPSASGQVSGSCYFLALAANRTDRLIHHLSNVEVLMVWHDRSPAVYRTFYTADREPPQACQRFKGSKTGSCVARQQARYRLNNVIL